MHLGAGFIVLFLLCTAVAPVFCKERVFMEREKMEDQVSSGSGWSYNSDSSSPGKYMSYSDSSGGYEHMMYPYAPGLGAYYEYHHIPTYDDPALNYVPSYYLEAPYTSYGYPSAFSDIEYPKIKHGWDRSDWDISGGKDWEESEKSSKGEKGEEAFKKLFGWDKESEGKHEKEQNEGWYGAEGGSKKGSSDEKKQWQEQSSGGQAHEGGSFQEEKGHKKGVKTTGYHKVYHKDEFKKDHTFYDQEDKRGHFDKYGASDSAHEEAEGAFKEGGEHKSGYHKDESGKKGFRNQGYHFDKDEESERKQGEKEYHKIYEDYAKKEGEDEGKEFGEKEHWHY